MNKHTLNYHTRLHEWYRQHSIQVDKQHGFDYGPELVSAGHSLTDIEHLSQDKLVFINEWCAEVNRTLFTVKRKESPPLYRRCRLSAPPDKIEARAKATAKKSADPRRVKSAEVFTLTGYWAKQHRANIRGGELLASAKTRASKNGLVDKDATIHKQDVKASLPSTSQQNDVDLCIRNSKEGTGIEEKPPMGRVNHDSLNVRSNAFILRQHNVEKLDRYNLNNRGAGLSPRSSFSGAERGYSFLRRAKSAGVTTHTEQYHSQREMELIKNAKNQEESSNWRGQQNTPSMKSGFTSKTGDTSRTATDYNDTRPIIEVVVTEDKFKNAPFPTFCNKCAALYSDNGPVSVTPETCGNCIHGINITGDGSTRDGSNTSCLNLKQETQESKRTQEVIAKLDQKINEAEIERKNVINRLTDDSTHYSSERYTLRHKKAEYKPPNNLDDLEDDRNLSFEDRGDDDEDRDSHSDDAQSEQQQAIETDPCVITEQTSQKEKRGEERHVTINITMNSASEQREDRGTQWEPREDPNERGENDEEKTPENSDDEEASEPPPEFRRRLANRRRSLSYEYKPNIGNPSTSNSLLNVLSIDNCKMAMRYSPHKVLENHEVTDNLMLPLAQLLNEEREDEQEGEEQPTPEQVAMRVSKGSVNTSLRSSVVQDATRVNKKRYQVMYDPEDYNHFAHRRPGSACLAKAFHTLIHDRTVLQRLDHPVSSAYSNNTNGKLKTRHSHQARQNPRAMSAKKEGPGYRRANAALRRHMGNMLQEHCNQLRTRYERMKNAPPSGKKKSQIGAPLSSTPVSDLSLSLDSLPSVKKGILKNSRDNLNKPNFGSNDNIIASKGNINFKESVEVEEYEVITPHVDADY